MYFPSVASDALSGPLSLAQLGCLVNFRCGARDLICYLHDPTHRQHGRDSRARTDDRSQLDREIANQVEDRAYGFTPIF